MESIEDKYGIIYIGNKHYYIEDLTKRDYTLENCLPLYLNIEGEEFNETTWINLLPALAEYLIEEFGPTQKELCDFSLEWSKAKIFSEDKKINSVLLSNGLYLNCNHTAQHSCWVVQDLVKYFDISLLNCKLIIRRNPKAEKKEVKDYFKNKHKEEFKSYVLFELGKDEKYYDSCIKALDSSEKLFNKLFPTFESLYYFDDYTYFCNYKVKFLDHLKNKTSIDSKTIEAYKKRFDIYGNFLKEMYQ